MTNEELVGIPRSMLDRILAVAEAGLENAQECLNHHMEGTGGRTRKAKYVADMYQQDIANARSVLAVLKEAGKDE